MNSIDLLLAEEINRKNLNEEYPFSKEEQKWMAQSMAEFYELLEKNEVEHLKMGD
ncbi:hypothetical protein RYD26_05490 [Pasteurellaceae bacterium LIM206]|nr:hypothetical protein [Pasteurellaceae bacterium LIM206]